MNNVWRSALLKVKREDFVPDVGFSREDMGENPPALAMLRHLMGGQNSESRKQETKATLLTSWLLKP